MFLPSGCNLTSSPVIRAVDVVSHKIVAVLHAKQYRCVVLAVVPEVPDVPIEVPHVPQVPHVPRKKYHKCHKYLLCCRSSDFVSHT